MVSARLNQGNMAGCDGAAGRFVASLGLSSASSGRRDLAPDAQSR